MHAIRRIGMAGLVTLTMTATGRAQTRTLAQESSATGESTSLLGRPARLRVANVTLPAALAELQKSSGVALAFSPSMLPERLRVSCACESVTVREALDRLLLAPGLRYREVDGTVVILPQLVPPLLPAKLPRTEVITVAETDERGGAWLAAQGLSRIDPAPAQA